MTATFSVDTAKGWRSDNASASKTGAVMDFAQRRQEHFRVNKGVLKQVYKGVVKATCKTSWSKSVAVLHAKLQISCKMWVNMNKGRNPEGEK